ncbi:MAG: nitrate ABC transporter [Cyanobacteria bacterium K_Offshore_surface_m2_011]|nr:nitrate ABC transporter [Cyanobacteria bacterium K_Offshore_surface_m2_011]
MLRTRRRPGWFLLGMVALALMVTLASCFGPSSAPLRIGANLWTGYETLYLARDLGELKDKPIRLIDFPSGTEEVRAYRNNEIDGAGLSIDQVITLAATQGDIRIIAIMDYSNGGDVILARPGLATMQDLKGKRIGVEATALGAFFLGRALELNGLSPQDVKAVSLELSDHEAAYRAGKVDAVVTFGPARTNLLKAGAIQLFDSSLIPGEIVDTLAASTKAIADNGENLQALVAARFKALDYFQSNPTDATRRMARRTQVNPEEMLESFRLLQQPLLEENVALLSQRDRSLVVSMTNLIRVMHESGLITKKIDPATLLDPQFVERVWAER